MLLFGPEAGAVTLALDAAGPGLAPAHGPAEDVVQPGHAGADVVDRGHGLLHVVRRRTALRADAPDAGASIGPSALLAACFYVINTGLIAGAIAFETQGRAFHIWRTHFVWLAPGYAASASVALLLVGALQQVKFTTELMPALFLVPPLFLVFYFTLRASFGRLEDAKGHVATLNRLYLSTVETLATAIDAKDEVTHGHIRRVQIGTVALARALGVNDDLTLQALEAAALLHDTGKIAVPEHILNKPGKLTPAEFEKMKLPRADWRGDPLVDRLPISGRPDRAAPSRKLGRHRLSRRPEGRRTIPIGARILSVVDCFDALTSDRPYRRRMSDDEALEIVLDRRGTMYDPAVVDIFVASYKEIMPPSEETAHPVARALGDAREAVRQPIPAAEPTIADAPVSDEVLAVTSLARAVAGDASLTDVGALAWMMIRTVVPCASMALFVNDDKQDAVTVRFAAGAHAATLRRVRQPRGAGSPGGRRRRGGGVLNADPGARSSDRTVRR